MEELKMLRHNRGKRKLMVLTLCFEGESEVSSFEGVSSIEDLYSIELVFSVDLSSFEGVFSKIVIF